MKINDRCQEGQAFGAALLNRLRVGLSRTNDVRHTVSRRQSFGKAISILRWFVATDLPEQPAALAPKMEPLSRLLPFVQVNDDIPEPVLGIIGRLVLDELGPALHLECPQEFRLPAPPLIQQHHLAPEGQHEAVENRQVRTRRPWRRIAFRNLFNRALSAKKSRRSGTVGGFPKPGDANSRSAALWRRFIRR